MIRVAKLRSTGPLPADESEVLGMEGEVFRGRVEVLPRMRANLWHQAAIQDGVQDLRSKLVVYLTRELQRVHSILGKPIDDLVIKLVVAWPMQRNSAVFERGIMTIIKLKVYRRGPRDELSSRLGPVATHEFFQKLVDGIQSATFAFAHQGNDSSITAQTDSL